jgi:hypothetical protein
MVMAILSSGTAIKRRDDAVDEIAVQPTVLLLGEKRIEGRLTTMAVETIMSAEAYSIPERGTPRNAPKRATKNRIS